MSFSGATKLVLTSDVGDERFDAVVVVTDSISKLTGPLKGLKEALSNYKEVDSSAESCVNLIKTDAVPSKRVVFSPTGPLDRDIDDVRRFADAALSGIEKALSAGSKAPLLVRAPDQSFPHASLVAVFGALQALYKPLEVREAFPESPAKAEVLGVLVEDAQSSLGSVAEGLESGRRVARDIGGSDPERTAAPRVEAYVRQLFEGSAITVKVESGHSNFKRDYPLLAAVDRAANEVERHQGRVIFLEYCGEGTVDETLLLVGKGITYDTGGADIKAGGIMAGMHRDKCGAAAVAGFFQVLEKLRPKGLKVCGVLCMVRNSVGEESYVADEIITSRAGVRVRIGNTDAEGRMVMTDLLCSMKEKALEEVNPTLFTVATLTGHAIIAMGPDYTIAMGNGPAANENLPHKIQSAGEAMGDPVEISTMRREDFKLASGRNEYEDALQCNNTASSRTPRGHQLPAAFMVLASGLDKHGKNSDRPLKYVHLDIAGSSGPYPGMPTGSPILALSQQYVLPRL